MKKITFILFALIAGTTFAQNSATATGVAASATIVNPLAVTVTGSMQFGQIASTSTAGTIILKPVGGIDATDPTMADHISSSTISVPTFNVTGEKESTYAITLPDDVDDAITLSDGGANSMTVTEFTASKSTGTLDATDGKDSFTVGAKLTVKAFQVPGNYTGSFDVKVDYN